MPKSLPKWLRDLLNDEAKASAFFLPHHQRVVIAAAMLTPIAAIAASVSDVTNAAIDSLQGQVVSGVVNGAMAAFFSVVTFVSAKTGLRMIEFFDRNTISTSADRFANSVIDELQRRFLGASIPDLKDLVRQGVTYIEAGIPTAAKKLIKDRQGLIVTGALNTARLN